jgi:hypothetical protein
MPSTTFNTGAAEPGPPGEPLPDPDPSNIFFNPSANLFGAAPSPGITLLPGAVPLFKANVTGVPRLVGGIGVYVLDGGSTQEPNVEAAEFAAIQGASGSGALGDEDFFFDAIPLEGAITIVGILLPYVKQVTVPAGFTSPRVFLPGTSGFLRTPVAGRADPFGYLMGPQVAQVSPVV